MSRSVQTLFKGLLDGHSLNFPTRSKPRIAYSVSLGELTHGHFLSLVRQEHVPARVEGLRISRGPSAILREVSLVNVNTLKFMVLGRLAHIFSKLCEIIPSRTKRYSPAAVMLEVFMPGIKTSRTHVSPRAVSARFPSAVDDFDFSPIASATFDPAFAYLLRIGFVLISAVTSALPSRLVQGGWYSFNDCEAVEFLPA